MILIICDEFDTHADEVEKHLKQENQSFFRFNLDVNSLLRTAIHFENEMWTIEQNGNTLKSAQIKVVWPRRLTVSLTLEEKTNQESASFKLWKSEWNRCLYGVYAYLRSQFWMNPIQAASLMDNKFYQLNLAKQIGFFTPEYISSNNKKKLIRFAEQNETVALKFMSQEMYQMPDGSFNGLYVNKITASDINSFQGPSENPITLQSYVDKKYEVRCTYVDGENFACRIDSQSSLISNVDWRRYDIANTPHTKIEVPKNISVMIENLMKQSNLYYGAFDFIVDKNETWWYLEVNTAGQWLWIEDLVGLPISAKVASSLSIRASGVH